MKKLISLLMILSVSVACLSACGKESPEGAGNGGTKSDDRLSLNTFDDYDDVAAVFYKNMLGKIDVNKDGRYVSEGTGSAKIEIDNAQMSFGNYEKYTGTPYLSFTTAGDWGTPLTDLTKIACLGIDIYNANAYNVNVILKVNSEDKEILNDWAVLESGRMNYLRFAVNPLFLEEINGEVLEYNFYLDYPSVEEKTLFYVDHFYAVKATSEKPEIRTPAAGTIVDFSSDADLLYIRNISGEPKTSWVLRYNLPNFRFARSTEIYAAENKKSSLKLSCKGATLDSDSQPNIYFEEHQRYGIQILTSLVQKCVNGSTSALKARVMSDADTPVKVFLRIYDSVTGAYAEKSEILQPNEWTDVTLDDFAGVDISRPGKITLLYDSWNTDAFHLYIDGVYTEVAE